MKINEKLRKKLIEKGLSEKDIMEIEEPKKSNIADINIDISDELNELKNVISKLNEKIKDSNYIFGYYCKKKR